MGRVEAFRECIEQVEADYHFSWADPKVIGWLGDIAVDVSQAFGGSLDAAARLEAPLQGRGWSWSISSPFGLNQWAVAVYEDGCDHWHEPPRITVSAATEPRARLLAALRALLHEAETEAAA
jgi:hypothetical protein